MTGVLALPPGDFDAYLSGLDGTIVDSMPRNCAVWQQIVGEAGGELTEAQFYAWGGLPRLSAARAGMA